MQTPIKFEAGKRYAYPRNPQYQTPITCIKRTKCYATFKFSEESEEITKRIKIFPRGSEIGGELELTECVWLHNHFIYADWEW